MTSNENVNYCWQGYQFWTTTDEDGYYSISDIRPGDYNLYAWVPGFIGDYTFHDNISVTAGIYLSIYTYIIHTYIN